MFKIQQPLLGLETAGAAVAMKLAVGADDAVTGDDERHGIGGIGAANGARRVGMADLRRDLRVGAGLTVGDGEDNLQRGALEVGGEDGPVDLHIKRAALAFDILLELTRGFCYAPGRVFDVAEHLLTDVCFEGGVRYAELHGDQSA